MRLTLGLSDSKIIKIGYFRKMGEIYLYGKENCSHH